MRRTAYLGVIGVVIGLVGCGGDDGDAATGFTTANAETVGDGDGDPTGDGDGDGDGDPTGDGDGDGDGDPTGDGDGDPTGDGDGDGDGDPTGDGDGDGDGDPTGDGDGDPDPVPCDIAEATLEPVIPQVMLVLDKSGSMISNTWDHDQNPNTPNITRWNSLYNVVNFIIDNFDTKMDFGAMLFPSKNATNDYNNNACVVANAPEFPVSPDASAIVGINGIPLAGDMTLKGGTPGEDALDVSGMHLKSLDPDVPKAIVYISDGAANCGDAAQQAMPIVANQLFEVYDAKLPMTMANLWTNDGIPTYVVGIDISTAQTPVANDGQPNAIVPWCKMDELGEDGGKPKDEAPGLACAEGATDNQDFYAVANQIELQAALQAIIEDAISCEIPLDPVPAFPNLLEVEIGGMSVPAVMDCASEDGWVYTNAMGPYDSIELCGTWCDELKLAGEADVLYFCDAG